MEMLTLAMAGLTAIVVASVLTRRTGVATPLVLLVVGIVVSITPGVPEFELDPEWILVGALPPLLYASAVQVPVIDLRRSLGIITWLSVTLVVVSAVAVGAVVHWLVPEVPFAAGVALGAVVSPTDAVAATAIGKRLGLPPRLMTVLEGESLFNDASALVLLRTSLLAITASFSLGEAVWDFVRAVVLAGLIGLVVGRVTVWLRSKLADPVLMTAVSFIVPFLAFVPAEEAEASGVVAVVVAGLVTGHMGARVFSARERLTERTNWLTLQFLVENGVFLVMGLQVEALWHDLDESESGPAAVLGLSLVVLAVLLVLRTAFVAVQVIGERRRRGELDSMRDRLDRAADRMDVVADSGDPRVETDRGQRRLAAFRRRVARGRADVDYREREPITARGGIVIAWAGMRGVVTLAAALTITADVPDRTLLISVAFVVAVLSLLVYGGTLPLLIRRLGVTGTDPEQHRDEVAELYAHINAEALASFPEPGQIVVDGQRIDADLAEETLGWFTRASQPLGATPEAVSRDVQRMLMHRELIERMRDVLHEEQAIGAYSTAALSRAAAIIDAQELRLER